MPKNIEHKTLRPLAGYRVHATLVCAARSCPPLSRDAFREDILDKQLEEAMRRWLARADLNKTLIARAAIVWSKKSLLTRTLPFC